MALTACGLIFLAQLPRLARESWSDPTVGLDARLAGAFFAWMVAMPLVLYAIALLVQVVLRLVRWPATGYACRAALFWALLASTPVVVLSVNLGRTPTIDEYKTAVEGIDLTKFAPPLQKPLDTQSVHF